MLGWRMVQHPIGLLGEEPNRFGLFGSYGSLRSWRVSKQSARPEPRYFQVLVKFENLGPYLGAICHLDLGVKLCIMSLGEV